MDKQELMEILRSQSATFEEDVERKLDYLNSDDVFSEYVVGLNGDANDYDDEEDDDEEDDDDDEDDDEDDNNNNNEEQKNSEEQNVDDEVLKKQKLAAKIAAMRGLATPNFLKK